MSVSSSWYLVENRNGFTFAIGPVALMTSPKGPKVVVRTLAGTGVFTGQYARFAEQPVFRKTRWERPDRRSWRSGQQLNDEADRVPFTGPILLPLAPGNNPFFQAFSRGWCGGPSNHRGRSQLDNFPDGLNAQPSPASKPMTLH